MGERQSSTPHSDVLRVAALAEPVRRALYRCVVDHGASISREEAAAAAGVAVHTAKFHLDRLVEVGLLEVEFRRLSGRSGPGAGRPAKLYRRSGREVAVSIPPRRYDLVGHLLAEAVDAASTRGTPVRQELARCAARRGAELGALAATRPADRGSTVLGGDLSALEDALAAHGYEPRSRDGVVVLENCPFHDLAAAHAELVCGMNLALLEAAVDAAGVPATARLDPAPGRCCVVLVPDGGSVG